MVRQAVESSSIVSVGYCPANAVLEVEFASGGVYQYVNVPGDEYAALMLSASKGRHINAKVKGHYGFRRAS